MGEIWLLEKAHWPHISSDINKEKENLQNTVPQMKNNVEFLPLFNWDKLPKYHSKLSEYHWIQCNWTQRMQALATQQITSKYIRLKTTTTYVAHDSAGHFYLSSHMYLNLTGSAHVSIGNWYIFSGWLVLDSLTPCGGWLAIGWATRVTGPYVFLHPVV